MDRKTARKKFWSQKNGARKRGIGWELTFEQWLDWWGTDLDRRGRGGSQLQMQRKLDRGPYALGNIVKGHPRQNMKTWQSLKMVRLSEEAAQRHQAALDELPVEADEVDPEDESISAYFARKDESRLKFDWDPGRLNRTARDPKR